MLVSADDVAATLKLLLPGFLALSVFYWFGLAVRRTDWRWLLWSLLASYPLTVLSEWINSLVASALNAKASDLPTAIAKCAGDSVGLGGSIDAIKESVNSCATDALTERYLNLELPIALALGVVVGLVAVWGWRRLARTYPDWRRRGEPLAWSSILRSEQWVQATTDKMTYVGWVREVADPVETDADDLDIYLTHVKEIVDGVPRDLNVAGLLLSRAEIKLLAVLNTSKRKLPAIRR